VKVFLMGEAGECENLKSEKYDVAGQLSFTSCQSALSKPSATLDLDR
jgi:hypothetical protein